MIPPIQFSRIVNPPQMSEKRKEEMKETSRMVKKALLDVPFPPDPDRYLFRIVKHRIKDSGMSSRSYFVRKAAEYITHQPYDETAVKLALIAELATCVTYLVNQVVDEKNGINDEPTRDQNVISTEVLKGVIYEYIQAQFPEHAIPLFMAITRIFSCFGMGENLEKNHLNFTVFQQDKSSSSPLRQKEEDQIRINDWIDHYDSWNVGGFRLPQSFLQNYFRRTYLINTTLYEEMVLLLLQIYQKETEDFQDLIAFARSFGMIQQMVNDIWDFVPTEWMKAKNDNKYTFSTRGKTIDDAYADVRNGLITLPLIFFLNDQSTQDSSIYSYLELSSLKMRVPGVPLPMDQITMFWEMQHSYSLPLARKFVEYLANVSSTYLKQETPGYKEFTDMLSIAFNKDRKNVYYQIIDEKVAEKSN